MEFYDGVLKGIDAAINDETKILATEAGATLAPDTEQIGDLVYNTLYYVSE